MSNNIYDYIFIGSGVATAMTIENLFKSYEDQQKNKPKVLILEAGPKVKLKDRKDWWNIALFGEEYNMPYHFTYDQERTGDANKDESFARKVQAITKSTDSIWGFKESRVRAVGGSTMHWGGWSLRYKPEDFKLKTNLENANLYNGIGADWPIKYEDFIYWYEHAELALNVGADAKKTIDRKNKPYPAPPFKWSEHEELLAKAFKQKGLNPENMPLARFNGCMATGTCKYCPIGARYTATAHLNRLMHTYQEYIDLEYNATALALIPDSNEPERITKVKVLYHDQAEKRAEEEINKVKFFSAEKIIVCAGAYESPKLLMRSRSPKWENGIGNNHDQVGRYLVTHRMIRVLGKTSKGTKAWNQEYDFPNLMSRTWDSPERQLDGTKTFIFNDRTYPNYDLANAMINGKSYETIIIEMSRSRNARLNAFIEDIGDPNDRIVQPLTQEEILELNSEQTDMNVELFKQKSGLFSLPKTFVEITEKNNSALTPVVEDIKSILNSAGYEEIQEAKIEASRGDHSSGTCRMGDDMRDSVTNKDLLVHGTENLYVCSNAVFPTAAAVNPTLTLVALALRLGNHLAKQAKG